MQNQIDTIKFTPGKSKQIALARLDLIHKWLEFRKKSTNKLQADYDFVKLHNTANSHLFEILGKISRGSLHRWLAMLNGTEDYTKLLPQYKYSSVDDYRTVLTDEEIKIFMGLLLHPNRISIGKAIALTKYKLKENGQNFIPADITFRRFAKWFKDNNYDNWILARDGEKALSDKVEPYIKRDASLLEVGDILVADGHKLAFQVINPFTGKPTRATLVGFLDWKSTALVGYEIMLEENTQCIASALRSSIINLDMIPKVVYQDKYFQYTDFRTYEGEPLQENACRAAVQNKSLVAIFPTGGGKSLTFQLPALISGETIRGLTVVISPLQSLMKDQIDNLEKKNIVDAVTINGLLNPIERAEAIERVKNGIATILYISPEQLRSKTIEHLLLSRNVVRFVIDEAHCFSAWGQDFRVDYLYIADFIKNLQEQKDNINKIAISCFTATAKPKVIMDIKDYFRNNLGLDLELYASTATRENLHYSVLLKEKHDEKYAEMRSLIEAKNCSTIVYVDSVAKTHELAERLTKDGFPALPYNGRMEPREKIETQEKFINNEIKIIVATSAFGMGVDKQDIELIIHYNIPSSLEDYMQESGRAAREQSLKADCYILFSPNDIDKHFVRLNQTKLSMNEIQQVWSAIKRLTKKRTRCCRSPLEIAREAGWEKSEINKQEIEIKVKTALLALEKAGYIERKQNMPRLYATSIQAKNTIDAEEKMKASGLFSEEQQTLANLVISKLIASRSRANAKNDDAESRIDWLADNIGIDKRKIIEVINLMKQINLLANDDDMTAVINDAPSKNLDTYLVLEHYLLTSVLQEQNIFSLKELNEKIQQTGISCKVKFLRTIFNYWKIKSYVEKNKHYSDQRTDIILQKDINEIKNLLEKRAKLCKFIMEYLLEKISMSQSGQNKDKFVQFSVVCLHSAYKNRSQLGLFEENISTDDIEDALLYLHRIHVLALEGGFLVLYNSMEIIRIVDTKLRYKKDDYKFLDDYYKQKIQQIHIVGELLNILVKSYKKAIDFIKDYFKLDYTSFIEKYFKGRDKEIQINMTPGKYRKLFGALSNKQKEIIEDDKSKYIVVAAGPGSGKTRVLVHKLASLLTLEDIKSEQLLMLTFSRAAAIEFKKRLYDLIGTSAAYVEIKTFHSYCFDLLGRPGTLENSDKIVKEAIDLINKNEVEASKLAKAVLVIDEAQDMANDEFELIETLMNYNEDMRVIAVGDDDQNIYEFRGSNSKYFASMIIKYNATKYEMIKNYRSCENIVHYANAFVHTIQQRMKELDCVSNQQGGCVKLIKYNCKNIEEAIVNDIVTFKPQGSICILTNTNNEALRVLGLLNKKNIPAKLIQSLDGFNLLDLQEIRYIFWCLNQKKNPIQISVDLLNNIKFGLQKKFDSSNCLSIVMKMLDDFEKTNPGRYFSDLETFFSEAKFEDFYDDASNVITISTIHKSKGHEYDNVFMLMNNVQVNMDEDKRKIYVGMSRAKNLLSIHCNNQIFDQFANLSFVEKYQDDNLYNEPDDIILQLNHKDVVLDFFKNEYRQKLIYKLRSGDELTVDGDYLIAVANNNQIKVAKFSTACRNKINELKTQGYNISKATIRFIVFWKDKEEQESAIVLPDIQLKK